MAKKYLLFLGIFAILFNVGQSKPITLSSYDKINKSPDNHWETGGPTSNKGTLYKHVFVYTAPDHDDQIGETNIIRPQYPPGQKHINIIFVKAPSYQKEAKTEVILPEQSYQKTLIYVLVKKPSEPSEYIRVKGPEPTRPPRPEVFFIRYKNKEEQTDEKTKPFEYEENPGNESSDYYPTSDSTYYQDGNHSYDKNSGY